MKSLIKFNRKQEGEMVLSSRAHNLARILGDSCKKHSVGEVVLWMNDRQYYSSNYTDMAIEVILPSVCISICGFYCSRISNCAQILLKGCTCQTAILNIASVSKPSFIDQSRPIYQRSGYRPRACNSPHWV